MKIILLLSFLLAILIGCQKDVGQYTTEVYSPSEKLIIQNSLNLPESPFSYGVGKTENDFDIDHLATLGRVLFYDKDISADGKISCASCHKQSLAFADNKRFSDGVNGNKTSRNSIALGSLASFGAHYDTDQFGEDTPGLFWDERAGSIKDQLKQTLSNPNEMGVGLEHISELIATKDYYQILHEKAFNGLEITDEHALEALEAFINSIGSTNSIFETDVLDNLNYINGDYVTGVSEYQEGFELFNQNCNGCHGANVRLPLETSVSSQINVANNGLQHVNDLGVFEYTQDPADRGKFKVPGLRNIALSAPYMHDGRFETLEEVVEFYNSGITNHPNLHPLLKDGEKVKELGLTDSQKSALVLFLESLSDHKMLNEIKWSDPFTI